MSLPFIQEEYELRIRPEINALVAEVEAAVAANPALQTLYKGWRVFFSPVLARPRVLLIGINPGNGQAGNIDTAFWGGELPFEYTAYSYTLARETRQAFADAGLAAVFASDTMKTNYCFLSTTQAKELEQLTDGLGRTADGQENLGQKVYRKSNEWTLRFLALFGPQVVLCEGKTAYNWVRQLLGHSPEEAWDKESECGYAQFPEQGFTLIGYSRRLSQIRNKPALATLLQRFVTS
ncbi:hypothetical protein [Hymenobacter sp.]|uniref:hypothetical protein n=1 Tax=Hymenobacter sp. TaxID=1898978 RepID=UPI00286D2977|nr:hypothetical protein [Hymenobacter sp.]